MATLVKQDIVDTGLKPTYAAASSGGDDFANDGSGRLFLHIKNGDGSSHTATVTAVVSTTEKAGFPTLTVPNIVVAIPASEERMIGPFPLTAYGSTPSITYDAVTSVTIALIKMPAA
jgi:hypothetical protein